MTAWRTGPSRRGLNLLSDLSLSAWLGEQHLMGTHISAGISRDALGAFYAHWQEKRYCLLLLSGALTLFLARIRSKIMPRWHFRREGGCQQQRAGRKLLLPAAYHWQALTRIKMARLSLRARARSAGAAQRSLLSTGRAAWRSRHEHRRAHNIYNTRHICQHLSPLRKGPLTSLPGAGHGCLAVTSCG